MMFIFLLLNIFLKIEKIPNNNKVTAIRKLARLNGHPVYFVIPSSNPMVAISKEKPYMRIFSNSLFKLKL